MDIFCEEIVKKKKSPAEQAAVAAIWLVAWLLCVGLLYLGLQAPNFFMLLLLAAAGVAYGGFKLAARLNLEYEYSVTNGTLDIDVIVNRSSRRRLVSVELAEVDDFGPYDPARQRPEQFDSIVRAVANPAAQPPVMAARLRHPAKGRMLVVFQPGEKVLAAVQSALPRTLQTRR